MNMNGWGVMTWRVKALSALSDIRLDIERQVSIHLICMRMSLCSIITSTHAKYGEWKMCKCGEEGEEGVGRRGSSSSGGWSHRVSEWHGSGATEWNDRL